MNAIEQAPRSLRWALILAAAAALLLPVRAAAQNFDLPWWSVDGGGGIFSTGGVFSLGGTAGQPDAGEMAGGVYTLIGGFWAVHATPCPGDINGDDEVGQVDLGILLSAWGTCIGDPLFEPSADLDGSGCIDQPDLGILLANFGHTCP